MKHSFFKTLLMGAALLMGGVNTAWATDPTEQTFGSADATNWTATSGTGIKHGSTVTIKNVVMTFGGGTYSEAQEASDKAKYTDDQWDYTKDGLTPKFMPNSGSTSNGVTTIAENGTLPTHGAVYKFVLSSAGALTVGFKGGTTSGKIMLVQADESNKVTKIVDEEKATDKQVTKTYSLEAGTYYFFQCAHATNQVSGYRGSLQRIAFEAYVAADQLTPVEGLKVWNFEQSGWNSISTPTSSGLLKDQLWLSGKIDYEPASLRYNLAQGIDNQIRFKVKKGQTGRVVIVGKANNSSYGIQLKIGDGTTTSVCRGSINKVHTSDKIECGETDKEIVITAHGSSSVLLKKVAWVPETETNKTITLGNAGYSTFCPMTSVTIPADVKAYRLYSISSTTATWTEITGTIPGLTGVLLVGEGGKGYTFNAVKPKDEYGVIATGATSDYYGSTSGSNPQNQFNYLVGTYAATAIPASDATTSYYGLIKNTGTFGKVTGNVTIPAGMAYFSVSGGGGVHEFVLDLDGGETAIALPEQTTSQSQQPLYSLSGMRVVGKPAPGIYVQGGKKIVIK